MSNIFTAIWTKITSEATAIATWWKGTDFGKAIDSAANDAKAELEKLAPADIEQIAADTATAIIPGLATGNYAAAIAAGIAAAETGFKAATAQVSSDTTGTFATSIAKAIAQNAAAAPAVAAASTTASAT